jgi:hypothetical protein
VFEVPITTFNNLFEVPVISCRCVVRHVVYLTSSLFLFCI